MALLRERGELAVGQPFVHESIVGSRFTGVATADAEVAGRPVIKPRITGSAWITRYSEVVVDATDPFPRGLRVADIW